MSLLHNEDFVIYQLRTSFLANIRDGPGDRLITVNPSIVTNPTFRAAGWVPNTTDIKRTHSPPISTVTGEYFRTPRNVGRAVATPGEDELEGGMVTGAMGSNDTVGPKLNTKRRRRREQLEEDDSSELSEESDDEGEATQSTLQQIRFTKMPIRSRAGSSPRRNNNEGPSVLITSPSRPGVEGQLRRGSFDTPAGPFRGRARRDTTTSSEMSSENELDPSVFQRKQVHPRRAAKASHLLTERIQEDDREAEYEAGAHYPMGDSDGSMSSFGNSAGSVSLPDHHDDPLSSLTLQLPGVLRSSTPRSVSPKRPRAQPMASLQALPPPRPISVIAPVSMLTQALKAKEKKPTNPFERFATLTGKADPNPLYIRIYAPSSNKPTKPFELLVRRVPDGGGTLAVAEVIGFALFRYGEESLQPPITGDRMNVNKWNFRMVEDEEVDYDFPALSRAKAMSDFTSNNNRGARARSREKPWDEFALVQASDKEFKENEQVTPLYSREAAEAAERSPVITRAQTPSGGQPLQTEASSNAGLPKAPALPQQPPRNIPVIQPFPRNPITGPSFASAVQNKSVTPLDAPAIPTSHATPRTGTQKTLTVHFTDDNFLTRNIQISITTDTYIAEVFDQVCKRLNVDKAMFLLKVHGTTTVAPNDRTVEALGERADLDLVRKRFIGDGAFGLSGSPGSSSPNAPLFIPAITSGNGTPKKGKKGGVSAFAAPSLASMRRESLFAALGATLGAGNTFKRYAVIRSKTFATAASASRILTFDQDNIFIFPSSALIASSAAVTPNFSTTTPTPPPASSSSSTPIPHQQPSSSTAQPAPQQQTQQDPFTTHHHHQQIQTILDPATKVTRIHFSTVVGSKVSRRHPKMFSFGVFREGGTKRYDFEAQSTIEASEVVAEIRRGVEKFQDSGF